VCNMGAIRSQIVVGSSSGGVESQKQAGAARGNEQGLPLTVGGGSRGQVQRTQGAKVEE
jgi:hypothetical protein